MDCGKIREFIKTDYADNEAKGDLEELVRNHLESCSGCAKFEKELREKAIDPLRKIEDLEVPDYLWNSIRERLIREKSSGEGLFKNLIGKFVYVVLVKRYTYSLAIAMLFLIVGPLLLRLNAPANETMSNYIKEQAEYLAFFDIGESESVDFGTEIEKYFL